MRKMAQRRRKLALKYRWTPLRQLHRSPMSAHPTSRTLLGAFPLPWSHYVRLMSVENDHRPRPSTRPRPSAAAGRSGSSTARSAPSSTSGPRLSKDKAAMLAKGEQPKPEDAVTAARKCATPTCWSSSTSRTSTARPTWKRRIIRHLESFLLEMGVGFAFVARQKRIRIGDEWYRIDLAALPPRAALPGDHRPQDRASSPTPTPAR